MWSYCYKGALQMCSCYGLLRSVSLIIKRSLGLLLVARRDTVSLPTTILLGCRCCLCCYSVKHLFLTPTNDERLSYAFMPILRTLSHIPHSLDSSIIVYQLIKSQDNYVYGPITITVFTNTLIRSLVVDFSALSLFRVIA